MNYANVKFCDIANGEGVRTTLFVSGCRRSCRGCFNREAWDFTAGRPFDGDAAECIMESLEPAYVDGLTLLGGEPMEPENQRGLVDFVEAVKRRFPDKTIWCFSGDTFEDITAGGKHIEVTDRLLACIDVLVDGPFVEELHDVTLRFRGSSNQRIIDVPASLVAGEAMPWRDDPQFESHALI